MSARDYGSTYMAVPTIDSSGRFADSEEDEDSFVSSSDSMKSVIFGGIDVILTSFSIITGAAGGQLNWNVTLILGLAAVFANGLSVGCGEFLSSKAHRYAGDFIVLIAID